MTHLWPDGEPVETWGDADEPDGFVWQSAPHTILAVGNRWQVHTRWWEPERMIWRKYLKVTTDSGLLCLLCRDVPTGRWFLARLYD